MLHWLRLGAVLLCATILLQGCAGSGSLYTARSQFYSGQPQAALNTLNSETVSSRNQLLVHFDHGLIAHTAGQYEESVNAFKAAKKLLDRINYIGIREQSVSLVTNDWITSYKGEYSEKLWIHTFQMMNFLLLNNAEGAAVEARQALQVYAEHGDALKDDWYTRALMAMSFEAAGFADSAHIEYKKLLNDNDFDIGIARRAWQNARRLGREQDASNFKQLTQTNVDVVNAQGELIVFLQIGSIPQKIAGQILIDPELFASFPVYPMVKKQPVRVTVLRNDANQPVDTVVTELVDIARAALLSRGNQIAVKQALRIAAKKELAHAIRRNTDNGAESFVGGFITAAMFVSEIADTRSWETLPAQVAMVQIPLTAGLHDITLLIQNGAVAFELSVPGVNVQSNKTTYRSVRVGPGAPQMLFVTPNINPALQTPNS